MNFHTLTLVPDNALVMTIDEWMEGNEHGAWTPIEQYGHYAKVIENKMYEDKETSVWAGPPDETRGFTHVAWYQ